jgi:hypothetical protein
MSEFPLEIRVILKAAIQAPPEMDIATYTYKLVLLKYQAVYADKHCAVTHNVAYFI